MTNIYVVRHAEAEGNLYRRVQGHYNGPVTERGRLQIDALAERFRDIHIDAVYSSDLARTVTTSGAFLRYHDVPFIVTPRLREVCMGVWEDKPWGDVEYLEPEQISYFSNDPEKWTTEGCEPFGDLIARLQGIILDIAAKHDGGTVVAVSHGMAIRALLSFVLGIPSSDIRSIPHSDNTAVSLLEVEGGVIRVVFRNDTAHLTEELSTLARQRWWKNTTGIDNKNMRFEPLRFPEDQKFYEDCYTDSWKLVHGCLDEFSAKIYSEAAARRAALDEAAVMKAVSAGKVAGIIDLDTERGSALGEGWIVLCYLMPDMRGKDLAAQLLGHALSYYRGRGRKKLVLHVSEANPMAIKFYRRYGFVEKGKSPGCGSDLLIMEKVI